MTTVFLRYDYFHMPLLGTKKNTGHKVGTLHSDTYNVDAMDFLPEFC